MTAWVPIWGAFPRALSNSWPRVLCSTQAGQKSWMLYMFPLLLLATDITLVLPVGFSFSFFFAFWRLGPPSVLKVAAGAQGKLLQELLPQLLFCAESS